MGGRTGNAVLQSRVGRYMLPKICCQRYVAKDMLPENFGRETWPKMGEAPSVKVAS